MNPVFFFRRNSIYAEMVADAVGSGIVPGDAEITMLRKKKARSLANARDIDLRILLRNGAGTMIRVDELKELFRGGKEMHRGGGCDGGRFAATFEGNTIVIEPIGIRHEQEYGSPAGGREALRLHYQREMQRLLTLHRRGMPAFNDPAGGSIAVLRSTLVEECVGEAVRIAQDDMKKNADRIPGDYAVVLLSGAVRGLSLSSDIDYIVLCGNEATIRGDGKKSFRLFIDAIDEILAGTGMKTDNLALRFSEGRLSFIGVHHFDSDLRRIRERDSFARALLEKKMVGNIGNSGLYRDFCTRIEPLIYGKKAAALRNWYKMYLRQEEVKNSVRAGAVPPPGVWLREAAISTMLARLILNRIDSENIRAVKDAGVFGLLGALERRNIISAQESEYFLGAYEFFMRVKNEGSDLSIGKDLPIGPALFPRYSGGLGFRSDEQFQMAYWKFAGSIDALLRTMRKKLGHSDWKLSLLRPIYSTTRRVRRYIKSALNGGVTLTVIPMVCADGQTGRVPARYEE